MSYRIAALSILTAASITLAFSRVNSADAQTPPAADGEIREGHSYHGEAFDEGPRQAAYLMKGMGNVDFQITTKQLEAQKFFNQGVAQLHGFWYFEAERSFRQAAAIDPDCAMAYWGMTLANVNNKKRAEKFIAEAVARRENASRREQLWIDAWSEFYKPEPAPAPAAKPATPTPTTTPTSPTAKPTATTTAAKPATTTPAVAAPTTKPTTTPPSTTAVASATTAPGAAVQTPPSRPDPAKQKARAQALIKALENIVHEYPDDIEGKAYLVLTIWSNRGTIPYGSHQAVDALIDQVLAKNPMHPIHHYRIHLWDDEKASRALKSAALGGQSTPGIAHMWHMPGHTFSKLQRYDDAAWQQEAASRTDHAYMMRDIVLPDQIHNYAHNHEWLIRDLSHIGRVRYGVELSKNLIEMPRHPKYNTSSRNGTAQYGRTRLIELLQRFELWDELLALADTPYLEPTDLPREQVKRLRALGAAAYVLDDTTRGKKYEDELSALLTKEQAAQKAAADKAESDAKSKKLAADKVTKAKNDAMNPFRAQIALIEAALADVRAHALMRQKKYADSLAQFKKAGVTSGELLARVQLFAGNKAEAERLARLAVTNGRNQVVPLANLTYMLWQCGKESEAKKSFAELRTLAASADLDVPPFERLQPLAAKLGWPTDWRTQPTAKRDIGERPPLDSLGPIIWSPPQSPSFSLTTLDGKPLTLAEYRGRNVVFVFYLGVGCLHCTEQLKALSPMKSEFEKAGIEIVAVSTDSPEVLKTAIADLPKADRYPFTIVSNADVSVFKRYRAYDDFEKLPLHATVLVDARGALRWIDVGPEPFMDVKFLLGESKRLLSLPSKATAAATTTAQRSAAE